LGVDTHGLFKDTFRNSPGVYEENYDKFHSEWLVVWNNYEPSNVEYMSVFTFSAMSTRLDELRLVERVMCCKNQMLLRAQFIRYR